MRVAGIRELRANTADLLGGSEPLMITRHGKISGVYLPLEEPNRIPLDLRRELVAVLGRHLGALLEHRGVTEKAIHDDFRAFRRRRRR